jgi:hypothetical protein
VGELPLPECVGSGVELPHDIEPELADEPVHCQALPFAGPCPDASELSAAERFAAATPVADPPRLPRPWVVAVGGTTVAPQGTGRKVSSSTTTIAIARPDP